MTMLKSSMSHLKTEEVNLAERAAEKEATGKKARLKQSKASSAEGKKRKTNKGNRSVQNQPSNTSSASEFYNWETIGCSGLFFCVSGRYRSVQQKPSVDQNHAETISIPEQGIVADLCVFCACCVLCCLLMFCKKLWAVLQY